MWSLACVSFRLGSDIMIPKEIQKLKSAADLAHCSTWISLQIGFIISWMHNCWEVVEFSSGVLWLSSKTELKIHHE